MFLATTNQILEKFGRPNYYCPDKYVEKSTREWELELEDGTPFYVYDWKEYRFFDDDEPIWWHVGTQYYVSDKKKHDINVKDSLAEAGFSVSYKENLS